MITEHMPIHLTLGGLLDNHLALALSAWTFNSLCFYGSGARQAEESISVEKRQIGVYRQLQELCDFSTKPVYECTLLYKGN